MPTPIQHTAYSDLVNVPVFGKKREEFSADRGEVSFYCRDCRTTVSAERKHPQKCIFECPVCHGTNISIGTTEGLKDFYHS